MRLRVLLVETKKYLSSLQCLGTVSFGTVCQFSVALASSAKCYYNEEKNYLCQESRILKRCGLPVAQSCLSLTPQEVVSRWHKEVSGYHKTWHASTCNLATTTSSEQPAPCTSSCGTPSNADKFMQGVAGRKKQRRDVAGRSTDRHQEGVSISSSG